MDADKKTLVLTYSPEELQTLLSHMYEYDEYGWKDVVVECLVDRDRCDVQPAISDESRCVSRITFNGFEFKFEIEAVFDIQDEDERDVDLYEAGAPAMVDTFDEEHPDVERIVIYGEENGSQAFLIQLGDRYGQFDRMVLSEGGFLLSDIHATTFSMDLDEFKESVSEGWTSNEFLEYAQKQVGILGKYPAFSDVGDGKSAEEIVASDYTGGSIFRVDGNKVLISIEACPVGRSDDGTYDLATAPYLLNVVSDGETRKVYARGTDPRSDEIEIEALS